MAPRPLVLLALGLASCVTGAPFINSSLDFNRGRVHRLVVMGERELVAEALTTIVSERGGALARRRQLASGSTLLSFRREVERLAGSRSNSSEVQGGLGVSSSSQTEFDYLSYGSLLYVELSTLGPQVVIEVVGLPVVDGVTACPSVLNERAYRDCTARQPPNPTGESYSDWAMARFDVPSNGRREADFIESLFAELTRPKWRDQLARPAAERAFEQ